MKYNTNPLVFLTDMLLSLRGRRKASQPSFHNVIYLVTYIMIPLMASFREFINQSFYKKIYEKIETTIKKY